MKQKNILMMQNWMMHLSHEILHGALDCLVDSHRSDITLSRIPWSVEELQHACGDYQVDGLIVPIVNDTIYKTVRSSGWKRISTHIGFKCPGIPQVDANHSETGRMAADYFLDLGFDHFAYTGMSRVCAMQMRRDGFITRIKERGHTVQRYEFPQIIQYTKNPGGSAEDWVRALPKPVAIYCSDDQTASSLIFHCKQLNLYVPDQVAVLGTEDSYELCRASQPDISSVHIPYRKIGYAAMENMMLWLDGKKKPPPQTVIEPDYVAARTSTDTLAIQDEQLRKAMRILREHCTEKIAMDQVASSVGISLRVLQQKFKNQLGRSPLSELHRARIAKVKNLLRETSFSLEEIAGRCGYLNANYLCEHFKKMDGQSPGEYRNKTQSVVRR